MKSRHQALARRQDIFYISMNDLITRVGGGTVRLREISQPHVGSIKNYILTNLENKKLLMTPLIGHREHGSEGDISIIDGSHRLKAYVQLQQVAIHTIERKDKHESEKALHVLGVFEQTILPIHLYEGLTVEQQHQFYLDHNHNRKQTSGKTNTGGEEEVGQEKTLGLKSGRTEPKGLKSSWVYQL